MHGRLAVAATTALALGACDIDHKAAGETDRQVHIAIDDHDVAKGNPLSIDVPGFAGKMNLPAIDMAKRMDLDGIKLAPGTTIKTIDVADASHGREATKDQVKLSFAAPGDPTGLITYYREQAQAAGYTLSRLAPDPNMFSATKGDKALTIVAVAAKDGSSGTILLTGK